MNNYMQRKIAKAKEEGIDLFLGQNLYENKQDSIWYDGLIASFTYNDRYEVKVVATGDTKVNIDGCTYKFPNWDDLYENGIKSDHDLFKKLNNGTFGWLENNWFEYSIYDKEKDDYLTDFLETDNVLDGLEDALDIKAYITFINKVEKQNNKERER